MIQKIRLGSPVHGILAMFEKQAIDLVVMGASGKSKLESLIMGSTTENIVRQAKCAVITVHEKPISDGIKNIAYASSLNSEEAFFSEVIQNVPGLDDAMVHLVRINTPMNFRADKEVKALMDKFARKLRLKKYTLNVYNDFDEESGIIHFANSINADLIAMSTHGRTGLAHAIAGSIAEDVANHAQRPVLTRVLH